MLPHKLNLRVIYLALSLFLACGSSPDVDGVWHATPPPAGPANTLPGFDLAAPGLELVVATYGPDLAGLVRYYRTKLFDVARSALPPWRECECAYLHQARISATGRVTFELGACVPAISPDQPLAMRGEFDLQSDGSLQGALLVDDPSRPDLHNLQVQLKFVRETSLSLNDPKLLACVNPVSLAEGNTGSGL